MQLKSQLLLMVRQGLIRQTHRYTFKNTWEKHIGQNMWCTWGAGLQSNMIN